MSPREACGVCRVEIDSSHLPMTEELRRILCRRLGYVSLRDYEVALCRTCLVAWRIEQRSLAAKEWADDVQQRSLADYRTWTERWLRGEEKERPKPPSAYFRPETLSRFAQEILEIERMQRKVTRGDL